MTEIWKDIAGYEGMYQVSDMGQVRSLPRTAWNGQSQHLLKGRVLKQTKVGKGYFEVSLCKNSNPVGMYVHRLVLETFVGLCPDGMQCRHFPNRETSDNRLENLSWGTQTENEQDKLVHGTDNYRHTANRPRGEKQHKAVITEAIVTEARQLYKDGVSVARLARRYGVNWQVIDHAVKRVTWKHVA